MVALTVTIDGDTYDVYADTDFADAWLKADVSRAAAWAAITDDDIKGRGLVSATRVLQSYPGWTDGVPDIADPPEAVQQAASMLAADLIAKPALQANPTGASNVKRAKAGSAEVEFFYPSSSGTPFPSDIWALLIAAGLVGGAADSGSDGFYASGLRQRSHFGPPWCDEPEWLSPGDYCG